jgi:hypothetical protein
MSITRDQARAAKLKLLGQIEGMPGLVGIGITKVDEDYAVMVNLRQEGSIAVPVSIDGVPVRVEVVGDIRPLADPS